MFECRITNWFSMSPYIYKLFILNKYLWLLFLFAEIMNWHRKTFKRTHFEKSETNSFIIFIVRIARNIIENNTIYYSSKKYYITILKNLQDKNFLEKLWVCIQLYT